MPNLIFKFVANDSGLRDGIKRSQNGLQGLKKTTSSVSSSINRSLASIGLGLSFVTVGKFFKSTIDAASNLSESASAVGFVFGKAAEKVQNFARSSSDALGQSQTQVLDAAKSFGIFGNAAGLSASKSADFSLKLVTLATDLASFNNTSVDDALVALQSGLRGESEPLRRFGILLDDATLRQEALRLGIIKTTKKALTPQQKILAANAVIFKQSKTQQGDFARTSNGLANKQRKLQASFENLKITIGEKLLPTFSKLVDVALQFIKDVGDPKTDVGKTFIDIKNAVNDAFQDVKDFFALFGNGDAMKGFATITSNLVKALPALAALKAIMTLAAAGKAIGNLILAMQAIAGGKGGGGLPGAVVTGKGGKGNPLPALLGRAAGTVGLVLMLGGDTQKGKKIPQDLVQSGNVSSGWWAKTFQGKGTTPTNMQSNLTINVNRTNLTGSDLVKLIKGYEQKTGMKYLLQ